MTQQSAHDHGPVLRVHPLDRRIDMRPGQNVRQALQEHGIFVESPCDGHGVCGKCKVRVDPVQSAPETPHDHVSTSEAEAGVRLACQLIPDQDLDIFLPPTYRIQAQSPAKDGPILIGKTEKNGRIQPAVQVMHRDGGFWLEHEERRENPGQMSGWTKDMTAKGLAVDLGTTTLVLSLICLDSGRELASAGRLNPQVAYGHDVLTRIQKASTPEGLELLASTVRGAINQMIDEVCAQAGSGYEEIVDVVIGGNTTMLEICAGVDPSPLGRLPFEVSLQSGCSHPASTFGLQVNPQALVYVPPIAHAFVGSDISAGLAAEEAFFGSRKRMLFLDVGTNGEMGVSNGQARVLSSTAAGPAFEGAGLSSGMRATQGAIQEVSFDGEDLAFQVIGDVPPSGVCGSGLFDLVYTLLHVGMIDASGRLLPQEELPDLPAALTARRTERDGKAALSLGQEVWLTQGDIRQLQLAKGAVRTGIDFLLEETGQQAVDLDLIVIGGGFGNVLRPASLEGVGLLPPQTADKVVFAGNTSQLGCARLLLSSPLRRRLEENMAGVEHIGLAQDEKFMDIFVSNMEFPQLEHLNFNHLSMHAR